MNKQTKKCICENVVVKLCLTTNSFNCLMSLFTTCIIWVVSPSKTWWSITAFYTEYTIVYTLYYIFSSTSEKTTPSVIDQLLDLLSLFHLQSHMFCRQRDTLWYSIPPVISLIVLRPFLFNVGLLMPLFCTLLVARCLDKSHKPENEPESHSSVPNDTSLKIL